MEVHRCFGATCVDFYDHSFGCRPGSAIDQGAFEGILLHFFPKWPGNGAGGIFDQRVIEVLEACRAFQNARQNMIDEITGDIAQAGAPEIEDWPNAVAFETFQH